MKKPFLLYRLTIVLGSFLLISGSLGTARGQATSVNSAGQIIPLPGHIDELILDEARGLAYAGNYSAGRVEVISLTSKQRISSFPTTPQPAATTGMAISPNRQWLVATNQSVTSGVPKLHGMTVVNLNNPNDRRSYAMFDAPLAIAFGANNQAVIITKTGLQVFNPVDGSFRTLFALDDSCPECQILPTGVESQLPRELNRASMGSSLDSRWIFGQTDAFLFSYLVRDPVGQLLVRPLANALDDQNLPAALLVRSPAFEQVSGSPDGQFFMAGHLLLNRDLRVVADSPEVPDPEANVNFVGGQGFDPDRTQNTLYMSVLLPEGAPGAGPEHPINGVLNIMDADNLWVRQQLRTADRITGRIMVTSDGNELWAISESGLLHIDKDALNDVPILEVNAADRHKVFEFNGCVREIGSQTIRIESPNGGSAQFSLSSPMQTSGQRPVLLFEPHQGVTPATVRVTVDPGALGPVQGVTAFPVDIATDAVNIPRPLTVIANVQDVDQRGTFIPIGGKLVEVAGDKIRDRFYVLDQENFQVLMYDSNDMRLLGSFRTGNTPTQMAVSQDGAWLVVANSQSEGLTYIDLNALRVEGNVFLPWITIGEGHYPYSIAGDNSGRMLIGSRTATGTGTLDILDVRNRFVSSPDTWGVYTNTFPSIPAVASSPDGSSVVVAEANGFTQLWEAGSQRVILARQDFQALTGTLGAGPGYFVVENHILNSSLVPRGDFPDGGTAQVSAGFAVMPDGSGVRSVRPVSQVDSGALHRIDSREPNILKSPVRMAAPPSQSQNPEFPFTRSLAALRNGKLISTSSAGIVEFPPNFDAGLATPRIAAVTNAADFTTNLGAGGLVSIFGDNLAKETAGVTSTPLPNELAEVCVTVNGASLPLLYVSPNQINAQLNFGVAGPVDTVVRTSGGISDTFVAQVDLAAPAIFSVTGPNDTQYAAVFRSSNNKLATMSNPLRPNEIAIIFATGLGDTTPVSVAGHAASGSPLAETAIEPIIEFGGIAADIIYSGLAPGYVGLYQMNVRVPGTAPLGLQIPLRVTSGVAFTTVPVRIVD